MLQTAFRSRIPAASFSTLTRAIRHLPPSPRPSFDPPIRLDIQGGGARRPSDLHPHARGSPTDTSHRMRWAFTVCIGIAADPLKRKHSRWPPPRTAWTPRMPPSP
jgi:hypothetical protein